MKVSTGHRRRDLDIKFGSLVGGLNLSVPPHAIEDYELHEALNFHYEKDSGRLSTRPGLIKQTSSPTPDFAIRTYPCTIQGTRYIIVSTNYKLYYYADGGYTEIGALANQSGNAIPSFAQYKENLYIASGDNPLQKWDGTTLTNGVTPHNCSIVIARGYRLYTNDDDDLDYVWVSQMGYDDKWGVSNNGFEFQAGWADGDKIIAMVPVGNDLAVVKGPNNKAVLVIKGLPPEMYVAEVVRGTGAVGEHALIPIPNDLLMLDTDGVNSLAGVMEYGDLKVSPIGNPIGQALVREIDSTAFWVNWPTQGITLAFPNNQSSLAYVLHYSLSESVPRWRWTRFLFEVPRITDGAFDHASDTLFLLGRDGHVYTMGYSDLGTTYTDDGSDYEQRLRTKIFDPQGHQIFFKRATFAYAPLAKAAGGGNGAGKFLFIHGDSNHPLELASFTFAPFVVDDWDDLLVEEAEAPPIGTPEESKIVRGRRIQRRNNFQLGITVTAGAISISRMDAHAAIVGRE